MLDPLVNPVISPKPIPRIVQARIVLDCQEPLDEDKDYLEKKHNARMP